MREALKGLKVEKRIGADNASRINDRCDAAQNRSRPDAWVQAFPAREDGQRNKEDLQSAQMQRRNFTQYPRLIIPATRWRQLQRRHAEGYAVKQTAGCPAGMAAGPADQSVSASGIVRISRMCKADLKSRKPCRNHFIPETEELRDSKTSFGSMFKLHAVQMRVRAPLRLPGGST